jgi:hypothetical protein
MSIFSKPSRLWQLEACTVELEIEVALGCSSSWCIISLTDIRVENGEDDEGNLTLVAHFEGLNLYPFVFGFRLKSCPEVFGIFERARQTA